jgi:hypothetical protein
VELGADAGAGVVCAAAYRLNGCGNGPAPAPTDIRRCDERCHPRRRSCSRDGLRRIAPGLANIAHSAHKRADRSRKAFDVRGQRRIELPM